MPVAPVPSNEALRQFELDQYLLVDTLPEPEFDDLVYLAACICDAPQAAVSLIDHDRQWFKASIGLDITETPRDNSFCAHTVASDEDIFIVGDAAADQRFRDSPLVTRDQGIRFYAGAALVNVNGFALGALCVMDTKPRDLTSQQRAALLALGRLTTSLIEQRRDRLEMILAIGERDQVEAELTAIRKLDEPVSYKQSAPSPQANLVAASVIAGATIGYALGAARRKD